MMNSEILDFRTLLTLVYGHFGTGEFTARELSDRLREAISNPALMATPAFLKVYRRVSRKMISNDLRRLYAMGFLKRRRVKRKVMTKSGKICYRGYEYKYSLSSQALKYLQYLGKGEEEEWLEELEDLLAKTMIEKNSTKELRDIFWELYKTQIKDRKGFRRFSTSKMAFWERLVEKIAIIFRDRRIESLEKENEELRRKLKELEKRNTMYKRYIKELMSFLVRLMNLADKALGKAEEFKKEKERYKEVVRRANKVLEELTSMFPKQRVRIE